MMQIADNSPHPTGRFLLQVFRYGRIIEVFEERNLIVDNSKLVHARLLGGDVTNRAITKIGFGTNGTAPAAGNTSLTNIYTRPIDAVSYPSTNQVAFDFSLGPTEANGLAISEFGLLTGGNVLYARKVRSAALNKDSDISLAGQWIISF